MNEKEEEEHWQQVQNQQAEMRMAEQKAAYENKTTFGSIAGAIKGAYSKGLGDMIKQESPFAKAMAAVEAQRERSSESAMAGVGQCEFIIVGVPRHQRSVETMFCTDAKDMQSRVSMMKDSPDWTAVYIFKRMLGYKARVEWEAVEADV